MFLIFNLISFTGRSPGGPVCGGGGHGQHYQGARHRQQEQVCVVLWCVVSCNVNGIDRESILLDLYFIGISILSFV